MKHAGAKALSALDDLITALRARELKERSPGVFYKKGRAWLHFHEDAVGFFADLRALNEWERFIGSTHEDCAIFLNVVDQNNSG